MTEPTQADRERARTVCTPVEDRSWGATYYTTSPTEVAQLIAQVRAETLEQVYKTMREALEEGDAIVEKYDNENRTAFTEDYARQMLDNKEVAQEVCETFAAAIRALSTRRDSPEGEK